jgi:hypothetical protein
MRFLAAFAFVASFAFLAGVQASPVGGAWAKGIEASSEIWKDVKIYRGGERASVQVVGKDISSLSVAVFDSRGTLVAEDKGNVDPEGNFMCASWYPPRDDTYTVEIRSSQGKGFKCYVTIR